MIIIGHRGAPVEALENSMSSFETAIKIGAHRIELDIQLSADKTPFVIHDATVDRTSSSSGSMSDFSQSHIQDIVLNNGEKIPSLGSVVEQVLPYCEINVELKDHNPNIVGAVMGKIPRWPPDPTNNLLKFQLGLSSPNA